MFNDFPIFVGEKPIDWEVNNDWLDFHQPEYFVNDGRKKNLDYLLITKIICPHIRRSSLSDDIDFISRSSSNDHLYLFILK